MYRNRWTYAAYQTLWVLVANLVTRYFWWPEEALFSWNIPIALAVGYLFGLVVWPIQVWMDRKHQKRLAALKVKSEEMLKLIEEAREATSNRHYFEAMAKIDEFLSDLGEGIEIKRNGRRSDND